MKFTTVSKLAKFSGYQPRQIRRLIAKGLIPATKDGGRWRIRFTPYFIHKWFFPILYARVEKQLNAAFRGHDDSFDKIQERLDRPSRDFDGEKKRITSARRGLIRRKSK